MVSKNLDFSVVVPVYNEDGNVIQLNKEIVDVVKKLGTYEVIYINDGSTDDTLDHLKELKKRNRHIKIIDMNRNYGQATALDAGFKACKGSIVVSMDGDLQNDPKDIPLMLEKLRKENLDVVAGWRKHRKDKSGIKILTKTGRLIRRILIRDDVHDTGCTLRVYKKQAVKSLDIGGEMHRYIIALLRWKGFRIGEVVVNHRPRIKGETKYGYDKAIKGFIDLLYIWFIEKYSQRPLHIFGFLGIVSILYGLGIEMVLFIGKLFFNVDLSSNAWFVLGFFLMLTGVVFFSFGIVLDLALRIHLTLSPYEKRYYIRRVYNGNGGG